MKQTFVLAFLLLLGSAVGENVPAKVYRTPNCTDVVKHFSQTEVFASIFDPADASPLLSKRVEKIAELLNTTDFKKFDFNAFPYSTDEQKDGASSLIDHLLSSDQTPQKSDVPLSTQDLAAIFTSLYDLLFCQVRSIIPENVLEKFIALKKDEEEQVRACIEKSPLERASIFGDMFLLLEEVYIENPSALKPFASEILSMLGGEMFLKLSEEDKEKCINTVTLLW